jgi:hypothetical protein
MWARVTFIRTRRHINPRTEPHASQRCQFSKFARNVSRKLIIIYSNIMARKCEQGWHSYEQDKPIHVQSHRPVNDVSFPSSLGMEPVSWLSAVQIEWQENVSKPSIHTNKKTHQSTYWATGESTMSVLQVRSEWIPWVDYHLFKYNGKEMWAMVTFIRTR